MGACRYCHEKAGLFKEAHDTCIADAQSALTDVRALIATAVKDSTPRSVPLMDDVSERLKRGRLTPTGVHSDLLRAVDDTVFELAKATPVSNEDADRIGDVYKAIEPKWFEDVAAIMQWRGYVALTSSNTIHEVLHGRVPYYTPQMSSGFHLGHDEHPIARRKAVLAEHKAISRSTYQSVSLPIGGGMYYRIGQSHPSISQVGLVPEDQGLLLITTRAIYFGGELHTFRIPFSSVVRIESFVDGFAVHENYGAGKVFVPYLIGTEDEGWFFYNVVSALLNWKPSQA